MAQQASQSTVCTGTLGTPTEVLHAPTKLVQMYNTTHYDIPSHRPTRPTRPTTQPTTHSRHHQPLHARSCWALGAPEVVLQS
jgi:hypothetical protein